MVKFAWVGGMLALLAACNTPAPRPWLVFQPAGKHDWTAGPDGTWVTRLFGADVTLDLHRVGTRVEVTVVNRSAAAVDVCMGPEASSPREAIGEYLLRALDGTGGIGAPPMQPYATMQRVVVDTGWRCTFHLDTPLGRDPVLGTYLVLTVEGRNSAGDVERRSMPLLASNVGTMPRDGR
jgi:hypothetical protein